MLDFYQKYSDINNINKTEFAKIYQHLLLL